MSTIELSLLLSMVFLAQVVPKPLAWFAWGIFTAIYIGEIVLVKL